MFCAWKRIISGEMRRFFFAGQNTNKDIGYFKRLPFYTYIVKQGEKLALPLLGPFIGKGQKRLG